MKIFWIKAGPFLPLDTGGKIRTWNILNELGKLDEVVGLCYAPSALAVSTDSTKHSLKELIALQYPAPIKYSFSYSLDYLLRLFSRAPYSVRKNASAGVRQRIGQLAQHGGFDVVVCDFLSSSLNMPEPPNCPQVLFAHNVETMIWKRHFEVERNPLRKLVTGIEYQKMRSFELRQPSKFDHVMAVSAADRDWFARFLAPERISILPTGVDPEYFQPRPIPQAADQLIFTGSMDWLPNEDAILYFAKEILPLIQRVRPEGKLKVAGRDPTGGLRELARANPAIELTGRVSDIRPHLAPAAVYVVPLRIGGGTRLKIYEAMAMGKPVVSTRIGAEGLPVNDNEHLLLADSPEKFASAVIRMLEDESLRCRISEAGRKLVVSHYGWPAVAKACHEILERVVKSGKGRKNPN